MASAEKGVRNGPGTLVCPLSHSRRPAANQDIARKVDADHFLVEIEASKQAAGLVHRSAAGKSHGRQLG
jgi:hypothetical protein